MSLVTLKPYLDGRPDHDHDYGSLLNLLAAKLTQHPLELGQDEWECFQSEISAIQDLFEANPTSEQFQEAIEAIGLSLERHHQNIGSLLRRLTGDLRSQKSELQSMISMLTRTIRSMKSASETSAGSMETITRQVRQASSLNDIRVLRWRLAECLREMEQEAVRQRTTSQAGIGNLSQGLAATKLRLSQHGIKVDVDPVTSFAGRSAAELALRGLSKAADFNFVLVVVLQRLNAINRRFGYSTGNAVLFDFATLVAGALCKQASFFRWSGPAIVATLQRSASFDDIKAEVNKVLRPPFSKLLDGQGQNALITVSAAWELIPAPISGQDAIEQIDTFVAAQTPE